MEDDSVILPSEIEGENSNDDLNTSQLSHTEATRASNQKCLFCHHPMLKGKDYSDLIQNALYSKHCYSQNYFYTKEMNDLLSNAATPSVSWYKEVIMASVLGNELLKRQYQTTESYSKLKALTKYYKFHKELPRFFILPHSRTLGKYNMARRAIDFKQVSVVIREEMIRENKIEQLKAMHLHKKKRVILSEFLNVPNPILNGLDMTHYRFGTSSLCLYDDLLDQMSLGEDDMSPPDSSSEDEDSQDKAVGKKKQASVTIAFTENQSIEKPLKSQVSFDSKQRDESYEILLSHRELRSRRQSNSHNNKADRGHIFPNGKETQRDSPEDSLDYLPVTKQEVQKVSEQPARGYNRGEHLIKRALKATTNQPLDKRHPKTKKMRGGEKNEKIEELILSGHDDRPGEPPPRWESPLPRQLSGGRFHPKPHDNNANKLKPNGTTSQQFTNYHTQEAFRNTGTISKLYLTGTNRNGKTMTTLRSNPRSSLLQRIESRKQKLASSNSSDLVVLKQKSERGGNAGGVSASRNVKEHGLRAELKFLELKGSDNGKKPRELQSERLGNNEASLLDHPAPVPPALDNKISLIHQMNMTSIRGPFASVTKSLSPTQRNIYGQQTNRAGKQPSKIRGSLSTAELLAKVTSTNNKIGGIEQIFSKPHKTQPPQKNPNGNLTGRGVGKTNFFEVMNQTNSVDSRFEKERGHQKKLITTTSVNNLINGPSIVSGLEFTTQQAALVAIGGDPSGRGGKFVKSRSTSALRNALGKVLSFNVGKILQNGQNKHHKQLASLPHETEPISGYKDREGSPDLIPSVKSVSGQHKISFPLSGRGPTTSSGLTNFGSKFLSRMENSKPGEKILFNRQPQQASQASKEIAGILRSVRSPRTGSNSQQRQQQPEPSLRMLITSRERFMNQKEHSTGRQSRLRGDGNYSRESATKMTMMSGMKPLMDISLNPTDEGNHSQGSLSIQNKRSISRGKRTKMMFPLNTAGTTLQQQPHQGSGTKINNGNMNNALGFIFHRQQKG